MTGCKRKAPPAAAKNLGIPVKVSTARIGAMVDSILVSGQMKALKAVDLSPKIPGRVISVPFREGDRVGAGSVVVQQDTADLRTEVRQAEAGLQTAQARLSQASVSAGLSDTQTEEGIKQAQAALDSAKARLRMTKNGARTQEVASAENAVISAKASLKNAESSYKRMKNLFDEGALSQSAMDNVQTQYDVAKAQSDTAEQQLSLVKAGARDEEIVSAQKAVDEAEVGFRVAKSNRANRSLRSEDIKSARAGVAQAEAGVAYARQQLLNAYIASPIAGTVSKRLTEPGQMANPGAAVMQIVALDTIYFEARVSETEVHQARIGQTVEVSIDALPGRKFTGTLRKILPTADEKSRQFTIRIQVDNRTGDLRPGMFARGDIEVAKHDNTVIIPKDALIANGEGQAVYKVVNSEAKFEPVTIGFETRQEAEILSGVAPSDKLVVVGQDKLSDGVRINETN